MKKAKLYNGHEVPAGIHKNIDFLVLVNSPILKWPQKSSKNAFFSFLGGLITPPPLKFFIEEEGTFKGKLFEYDRIPLRNKWKNYYLGFKLIKNEKERNGYCNEMKSLPYKSASIFSQKCMGGKL